MCTSPATTSAYTTGGLHHFSNARIAVSRRGWEHFISPSARENQTAERETRIPADELARLVTDWWPRVALLADEDDLDQKVIVLTGGASGLGRACAIEFARQGATVVIGDSDERGGRESAESLDGSGRFVRCDVSVSADCAALLDAAAAEFGRVDAVMSNAGIEGNGTVETCDEDAWDRVMAVNLKGMFLISKHAVPHLRRAGGGAILMTSSVSAFWGEPGTVS